MMKRIIALLLALILTVGLLPTVALAAGETANNDVKSGSIGEDGNWTPEAPDQSNKPEGVETVSKTAKPTSNPNEYEVELKVVLKQTSETKTGAAATALVLDCSGSMEWCTQCGKKSCDHTTGVTYNPTYTVNDEDHYYVKNDNEYVRVKYCDGKHGWFNQNSCTGGAGWYTEGGRKDHTPDKKLTPKTSDDDTNTAHTQFYTRTGGSSDTSRMTAAKNAAKNFLKTYSGFDANVINDNGTLKDTAKSLSIKRYVAVIRFSNNIDNDTDSSSWWEGEDYKPAWYDVSTVVGYNKVLATINQAWAYGGTNLDAGLTTASSLMDANLVKNLTSKNVIALTDGAPTYSKGYGDGGSTNKDICDETAQTAATLREKSKVYTVCFAAESDPLYNGGGTVGDFLKNHIATQPAEGSNEKYAYNAKSAEDLIKVFKDITDTIVSGLNNGTVKDSLPAGITSTDFGNATQFELNDQKQFHKDVKTETVDGKEVTTYTYTKTYTVNINPDEVQATVDGYAPLNDETTLTVEVDGKKETIPFPIPAGKVTPTTFTVTWKSQNGETTYETDANVEKNSKPSFDQADPTKTEDDMYTYTFVGWATSANQDTGTPEADLPSVIDNVTYYASFSKTQKTYTVTGTIDNGTVNNEASTDTQTVNAGESSTAMVFTPAAGYKIVSVTEQIGSNQATNITNFAETGYTYPVQNSVKANITVDVKTAKRSDLKYVVKHVEKDNATNVLATRDKTGTLDEVIHGEAQKENFTGFTYAECSPESIKISATEDNNVITLYYTKNKHNITYVYAEGSPTNAPSLELYNETDILYGAPKTRKGAPTLDGWTFNGWTTENVEVAADGTFSMPDKDVTFTGSWTQRATATINYVVVPNGAGTLSSYSETKYVDDTTDATGSSATPADDYRFVGWYAEEACSTLLSTNSQYTPTKTGDHWTSAIYYAKFEAIPTPGADDLPKVTVQCTNGQASHQQSSGKPLVAGTYNTSAVSKDTATGKYTCTITLTGKSDYINAYNTSTGATHVSDTSKNDTTEIVLTYDVTNKTWNAPTESFFLNVKCDTPTVTVTYEWTGLKGVVFDDDQHKAPTLPKGETVTKGSPHTVDFMYLNGSTVTDVDGNTYKFSGWNQDGTITVQENTTIRGTWTKSTGTFELDGKIFKSFTAPDDVQKDFYVTVTPQQGDTTDIRTGMLSLTGSTTTDVQFNFYNRSRITFTEPNTYTYLVEEAFDRGAHPDGIVDKIHYDTKQYLLTISVENDLTVKYGFADYPQTDGEAVPKDTITFRNSYFEDPNADIVTLDLSKYVTKTFESRHGKSATETFEARVEIWVKNPEIIVTAAEENAIAVYDSDPVNGTVVYDGIGTVKLSTGEKASFTFATNPKLNRKYAYAIRVTEVTGNNTDVEYDKTEYESRFGFYDTKEIQWLEGTSNFSFTNTYTGIDDYYPIIIPAIINKDTGMLNKTDHFAYVIGYPDGTVHPNGQITRAEVATIFFRLLRDEVRDGAFTTSNSYSDVAYGKWYNNPISTMSALGIITGYPDGTFKPNKPITRAEFAAIAARFDETQSGKSATFSDVIGHWAAKEIGIAYYNDWIKGYPDGTFKPDQNITRAEAMTLINRVLERKPESPADLLTNMNKWTDNMDTSKWYYLDVQEATNSHGYTRKTFNYELWRQMLPDPDWSRYER